MNESTLNLLKPVVMKEKNWTFNEYISTLNQEQRGSLEYIYSGSVEWNIPESVKVKVTSQGDFLPFFGDTTVFELGDEDINKIVPMIESLNKTGQQFLSEKIEQQTLHITLHDLSNGPTQALLQDRMQNNEKDVQKVFKALLKYITKNPDQRYITFKSTNIYPCINTAILLGVAPATEKDFKILINTYALFDDIVYLNYWLRPHITLGYFKPINVAKHLKQLQSTLQEVNLSQDIEIRIDILKLAYQHFFDMNNYKTLFRIK